MMMLTGNVNLSVVELANRLNMSDRTVYRYIDTFREAGFVIKKRDNAFRIDKSSPYFKEISSLVHFTDEEAFILKSAIESIDENNLIKQNLKKKLYTVYNYKILAETVAKGKNAQNVNKLVEAIEQKRQVRLINYSSAHSNDVHDRVVEPFAFTTNYVQVWAYEPGSERNKLFKLSRIGGVEVLSETWKFPEQHKKGHMDIFRISSEKQLPVRLRLSLRAAHLLMEEYPLAERELTAIGDNQWILETNVCSYEGVGRFVMGLLDEIAILGSEDFRNYVKNRISSHKKLLVSEVVKR
jgi:predicted DNA-binding transcriptional regulator YafY